MPKKTKEPDVAEGQNGTHSRTKRITFEDGNWWELTIRPTMGDVLRVQNYKAPLGSNGLAQLDALLLLTPAWSYGPVTEQVLKDDVEIAHVLDVLEVFVADVLPFFVTLMNKMKRSTSLLNSNKDAALLNSIQPESSTQQDGATLNS